MNYIESFSNVRELKIYLTIKNFYNNINSLEAFCVFVYHAINNNIKDPLIILFKVEKVLSRIL